MTFTWNMVEKGTSVKNHIQGSALTKTMAVPALIHRVTFDFEPAALYMLSKGLFHSIF